MRQYQTFKRQHPGHVLFFRLGDFYELFDEDAILVHKVLGLTLTERGNGLPMAGAPYHAIESYLRRMIDRGYRVAVADQIQDPKDAKGVIDRAVTRVMTPGTLVEASLLDESAANRVAAIQRGAHEDHVLIAMAEVSTGEFQVLELPLPKLADEFTRLRVAELLAPQDPDGTTPEAILAAVRPAVRAVTLRPSWTFRLADARDLLVAHYRVQSMQGFGFDAGDPLLGPAGAVLRYLQETQPTGESRTLRHLRPPCRRQPEDFVTIDSVSLRSLEIERTMRSSKSEGSLLGSLTPPRTPMGKRLLREWLCFPRRDVNVIRARQNAVGAIVEDETLRDALSAALDHVQDVARIMARIAVGRSGPRDLVALGHSSAAARELSSLLEARPTLALLHVRLESASSVISALGRRLIEAIVPAPPGHAREGGVIRDGIDAELDECRSLQRDANEWLAKYQAQLIGETGIGSLKIGFNSVFGYYIEITNANVSRVPPSFTRKQTLRNAERYVTDELRRFEEKVTTAEARAIDRERTLFADLCREAAAETTPLLLYAEAVAELDVLAAFAATAVTRRYARPEMVDEPRLEIRAGRHPVLEGILGDRLVPNDCELGAPRPTLALITGPNMAGKSTAIRQAALIALLAHTGSWVPAEAATIGLVDRIFTRVGASDELHTGQSTFMVEMTETASILHHATPQSLVILDEIGRGTSTLDGLALAWAITETMASIGCRTLFATHYHELTSLPERLASVTNLQVSVREWGDEIVFLYRIIPGRADRSYGIHVARLAGLPQATLARAQAVLETLTVHTSETVPDLAKATARAPSSGDQLALFTEYLPHPALDALRRVKLEELTPLAAFDVLRGLREEAGGA